MKAPLTPADRVRNIELSLTLLKGATARLAETADISVTSEVMWALSLAVHEKAEAVTRLVSSGWQGGVVEIVRSQMEAAADFILLARDDDYLRTLLARQDDVIVSSVNRSKSSRSVPGIKLAVRDQATRPSRAYDTAFAKRFERNKLQFADSIARAGLSEDHYRLFCAHSHHNVTALNTRFMHPRRSGEVGAAGTTDPLLLEASLDQCLTNCTKPVFALVERIKAGKHGVERGFPGPDTQ